MFSISKLYDLHCNINNKNSSFVKCAVAFQTDKSEDVISNLFYSACIFTSNSHTNNQCVYLTQNNEHAPSKRNKRTTQTTTSLSAVLIRPDFRQNITVDNFNVSKTITKTQKLKTYLFM